MGSFQGMAELVEIQSSEETVTVRTSGRNHRFDRLAAAMGGRRSGESWVFPARAEADVRECCAQVFGTPGREHQRIHAELLRAADAARSLDAERLTPEQVRDLLGFLIVRLITLRKRLPADAQGLGKKVSIGSDT